ncbi:MAG: SurA N-terminal domain-containing protein [Cytophagales bacterium]|nr:SurA N-terminal domain-containing protein [Cytophagales bacterium]
MAIISTLRDKMGKFLVVVVGFSIAAFVLGDILGPNSSIGNQNQNIVGEINGEDIDMIQFNAIFEQLSYNFSLNNGRSPSNQELSGIRDQAWEKLINDISYVEEYNKLGLSVSDRESVDMVQGDNIHPLILEAFTDPNTGVFNIDNVIGYLQNLSNQPVNQQQAWFSFESNLKPMRLRTKYDNLLSLTTNVNTLQSKSEYFKLSNTVNLSYYFVPYYKIPDSLFDVSNNEMKRFLSKNKDDYKQEESRSINYLYFPLEPSQDDSSFYRNEITEIISSLKSGQIKDSTFALLNSDGFNPYMRFNADELPDELVGKDEGYVSDYQFKDGGIVVYKLSGISDDQEFKARAKHILLRFNDQDKNSVRSEASRILSLISNGSDFDETARTYSQDGSASNGGDLGWFSEGRMVEPFEDAVFSRTRAGLIPRVIESEFGFHIIYVTQPKTKKSYLVTTILKEIIPSDNTRNNIYRDAEMFKIDAMSSNASFKDFSNENGYNIITELELDKNAPNLSDIDNARSVILWSYDDSRGSDDISDVIELDDGYIVAHLSEIKKEGTKDISDVENSIRKSIINDKKYEYVSDLMKEYSSLEDIKSSLEYGEIYETPNLDFNTNSIQNVGFAPEAIGVAFSMQENELTKPIKIDDGVIVLKLNEKNMADSLSNYTDYGISLLQANKFTSSLKIDQAIKKFSDIEDFRYKFF